MKKQYKLECDYDYNIVVLAINSHSKAHKLCWALNKAFELNFEITHPHKINNNLDFTRYKSKNPDGVEFNLLLNRSKKGYIIPSKKSINYFLIIKKDAFSIKKDALLSKLRTIKDILLVFELEVDKEKNGERFIIYDQKN